MAISSISHFKSHAEYLNKAFKKSYKHFGKTRYSYAKHIWIWFINAKLKENKGWSIEFENDSVYEEYVGNKKEPYVNKPEKQYRFVVLFESSQEGNTYYNFGLYEYDPQNSSEKKRKFIMCKNTKNISDNVTRYRDIPKRCCAQSPHAINPQASCIKPVNYSNTNDRFISEALKNMDKSFSETLFYYIDKKGISDIECYKKANVDRKIFSKIKCNEGYRPGKNTAITIALALNLNLAQTNHLLRTLGYSLSNSNAFDVIIRCCIDRELYDIDVINIILRDFDQPLIGH